MQISRCEVLGAFSGFISIFSILLGTNSFFDGTIAEYCHSNVCGGLRWMAPSNSCWGFIYFIFGLHGAFSWSILVFCILLGTNSFFDDAIAEYCHSNVCGALRWMAPLNSCWVFIYFIFGLHGAFSWSILVFCILLGTNSFFDDAIAEYCHSNVCGAPRWMAPSNSLGLF